jgi:hypothetical protein
VETLLKGYKYFEIERDFFNKLCPLLGDARIQGKEIDSLQKTISI